MEENLAPNLKLEACVRRVVEREGVPPFFRHGSEVTARSLDPDSTSSDLARIILKDMGLTSLILRVGNSAIYNRSGRPVVSVAHAITLLGWDTVRDLVGTARYIEQFAGRGPGLRELLMLSLLSATHSRDIASTVGYPVPEEAHVSGLMRNLGEVLLACHYPVEYLSIIVRSEGEKVRAAQNGRRWLDFSWDDLGAEVAAAWNLPARLVRSVRGTGQSEGTAIERSLASISDYGHELTHAVYRLGAEFDTVQLNWVMDGQGQRVRVAPRELTRIVAAARRETQNIFAALEIPTEELRLTHQAERAREILAETRAFDSAGLRGLETAAENAARTIRRGPFNLNDLIRRLLDAIRAAGFDQAIFGLVNESHQSVRGRLASGGVKDDLLRRFDFPLDHAEGPMLAALRRKTDLLVARARDDRYDSSELVKIFVPASFALLPVIVDARVAGCLYAGRVEPANGLDALRFPLARVRDVIAAAIRKSAQVPM